MAFCAKCGKEVQQGDGFCQSCGTPAVEVPGGAGIQPPAQVQYAQPQQYDARQPMQYEEPVSGAMWLLPIFLGWVGGVIAWVINKDKNPTTAKNMLITGIVISVVGVLLSCAINLLPLLNQ